MAALQIHLKFPTFTMEKLVTLCSFFVSKELYESLSGVQIYEITKLVDCYNKPKIQRLRIVSYLFITRQP